MLDHKSKGQLIMQLPAKPPEGYAETLLENLKPRDVCITLTGGHTGMVVLLLDNPKRVPIPQCLVLEPGKNPYNVLSHAHIDRLSICRYLGPFESIVIGSATTELPSPEGETGDKEQPCDHHTQ